MTSLITLTLKEPIKLPSNETLTSVTLKRANAGQVVVARAEVTRDNRFGPMLINDDATLVVFLLPKLVVNSNVAQLPKDWPMMLSEEDFTKAAQCYAALRGGFPSLEAFEADQEAKRKAAEEAEANGQPLPLTKEEAFPAGEGPTESQ